jgi:hypothetical protein
MKERMVAAVVALSAGSLSFVLGGCVSAPPAKTIYPQAVYAHRVSTPHVDVYWNCTQPRADTVRLEGVVQNTRGVVKFMELEAAGAGPSGGSGSSARTALPDIVLHPRQISPFSVEIRRVGEERIDLFYVYHLDTAQEGEDPRPRYMARDVCSPTAHSVRWAGA